MSETQAETFNPMLALFCAELGKHVAVLGSELAALQTAAPGRPALQSLQRMAQSVRNEAKLVGLDKPAEIGQALLDALAACHDGERLPSWRLHALAQAHAWLEQLARQEPANVARWLDSQPPQPWLAQLRTPVAAAPPVKDSAAARDSAAASGAVPSSPAAPEAPAQAVSFSSGAMEEALDSSLLDLYLVEAENYVNALNDGLLRLETQPDSPEVLESLMRSAHSIKGGAKVVGLELAVKLAHRMEDCFVAAQKGRLRLQAGTIDVLLKSVDMLALIAKTAGFEPARMHGLQAGVRQLEEALDAVLRGEEKSPQPPFAKGGDEAAAPSFAKGGGEAATPPFEKGGTGDLIIDNATGNGLAVADSRSLRQAQATERQALAEDAPTIAIEIPQAEEKDRAVRVTAGKIERLMGLSGEVVVSTRWLLPFSESLLSLKRNYLDMGRTLEKLQDMLSQQQRLDPAIPKLLARAREKNKECNSFLADRHNQLDIFINNFTNHSDRLYQEVIGVRMRPFADGVKAFPRMARDLARQLGKKVNFEILGKGTEVDQDILEKLDAPLTHLLRNALDHGLEPPAERIAAGKLEFGRLTLEASHRSGMLMISVSDDGYGIDLVKLRRKVLEKGLAGQDIVNKLSPQELLDFLFLPGFSTADAITEISGRGVGLDVVQSMAHEVGGIVRASSALGSGTTFHLELPLTLSVARTFLVDIAGEPYAFPLSRIERCLILDPAAIEVVEDRQYFRFGANNIALVNIHEVLELGSGVHGKKELHVVVVSDRFHAYGLVVDKFVGEYELVVRPLDSRLGKVPDISAVAVMLDGSPVLIFDVEDLVHSINKLLSNRRLRKVDAADHEAPALAKQRRRVLVVDDSITVREMERKLLENRGYQVELAVDGMDGWGAVNNNRYDLVVSDVDMPRLNGIEFIKRMRGHEDLRKLPVIIVSYKDSEQHRLMGLEAGANAYLTKTSFEDDSFLEAVMDLIGEPDYVA
jgi:two-component system sensor histidine kinase and response regulator WspE